MAIAHFGPKNVKISKIFDNREPRTIFKAPPIWDCRIELLQRSVARLRPLSLGQNGGNATLKRYVLSRERNSGREDEFWVSGGSVFQNRGPMTEKALLPIKQPRHDI